MNNTVYRTLCEKCGVKSGERIIVALSGGADSVSLLHSLLSLRESGFELEIFAAHVNHNLRGEESLRDEKFVRNLCDELQVELFVHSKDVSAYAKDSGKSIELAAREVRYEFFLSLARKLGAKVATAHTLSDSEETMLYNICRGVSLHGLCSIPYKRDYIVRPMLDVTRAQVEQYCEEHNLLFVQDSTNFDEDMCKRNKIRLAVMPNLHTINDGFDENFKRLRENLILADDYISQQADKLLKSAKTDFGYDAPKLLNSHKSVRRYALAQLIRSADADCQSVHLDICEEILANSGASQISRSVFAVCRQGIFRIVKNENEEECFSIPFSDNIEFTCKGNKYLLKILENNEIVHRKLASLCIGYDKISEDVVIRTREAGDTFTPKGRGVTKALRKLQNEMKIPAECRDSSLVIARGNVVLWAEYIGVSAQGALEGNNTKGVFVECIKL